MLKSNLFLFPSRFDLSGLDCISLLCLSEKRVRKMVEKSQLFHLRRVHSSPRLFKQKIKHRWNCDDLSFLASVIRIYVYNLHTITMHKTSDGLSNSKYLFFFFYYSFFLIILLAYTITRHFPIRLHHQHNKWQSTEFVRTSWSIKFIIKIIVSSRPHNNYFFTVAPQLPMQ